MNLDNVLGYTGNISAADTGTATMQPHFDLPPPEPLRQPLPTLPIVTPDPPKKTQQEKYGSLFYLGIAGLVVLLGLVGYFAFGVWSLRDVWRDIYTLHSEQRSEAERIQAAYALSRNPKVTQSEYWEICLRKPLPPLARYLMAEAITADTVEADPRAYALVVTKSQGWPDWLRLQLTRPLACAAARGVSVPREPLAELSRHTDPVIALWADFALAVSAEGDLEARAAIESTAQSEGPNRELAADLLEALQAEGTARQTSLDRATLWLRSHHPESARLWDGWEIDGDHLIHRPTSVPNLRPGS